MCCIRVKFKLLKLLDIVGYRYCDEYWFMSPSGRFNHRLLYWNVWDRFYTCVVFWVELPVQRRLCPIFVRNVGSPDIHECFRGLTGSQRTPGLGRHNIVES